MKYRNKPSWLITSLRIVLQVVGDRHPNGPLPAFEVVLVDTASNRSTFTNPGSISDQKTSSRSIRQQLFVLLACVDNTLKLGEVGSYYFAAVVICVK